jgi:hypothetical protein
MNTAGHRPADTRNGHWPDPVVIQPLLPEAALHEDTGRRYQSTSHHLAVIRWKRIARHNRELLWPTGEPNTHPMRLKWRGIPPCLNRETRVPALLFTGLNQLLPLLLYQGDALTQVRVPHVFLLRNILCQVRFLHR